MIFTNDQHGDELVARHMRVASEALHTALGSLYAVVLAGSYGRGEGVVIRSSDGALRPVNDYDIVVVTHAPLGVFARRRLRQVRDALAQQFGSEHIDLMPIALAELRSPREQMLMYDLKWGGTVLSGAEAVLAQIPFEPGYRLPGYEIENLLVNRMVTLLEGYPLSRVGLSAADKARQIAKVQYALIDAVTHNAGCHRTRYRDKEREIARIAQSGDAIASQLLQLAEWRQSAWRVSFDSVRGLSEAWHCARDVFLSLMRDTLSGWCSPGVWRAGHPLRRSAFARLLAQLTGKSDRYSVEQRMFEWIRDLGSEQDAQRLIVEWRCS